MRIFFITVPTIIQVMIWKKEWLQIGPFDRNRYLEQDLEPERNTALNLAINHERLYQEILANNKRETESKDYIDWVHRDIEARRRLRLKEEDVIFQFEFIILTLNK
jgi:hypothetical protein